MWYLFYSLLAIQSGSTIYNLLVGIVVVSLNTVLELVL